MPLTKLDTHAALIVIDLQKGITAIPTVHPAKEIIARAAQLAAAFRQHSFPVALVHVKPVASGRTDAPPRNLSFPPDWTDLVPELQQQPEDLLITKQHPGAFIGTSLDESLRR